MRPPMLDPERDLKGATPEELARALLRGESLRDGPKDNGDSNTIDQSEQDIDQIQRD